MTNNKDWKEFKVGKLFIVSTTKMSIKDDLVEGNTPFISRTAENNGCDGYVDVEIDKISKGNCLTIGAEGIYCFYQAKDFATGNKVYTLRNENLTPTNSLFIATILNKDDYKYSYGRARIKGKLEEETIKLPIRHNLDGTIFIDTEKKYSDEGYIPDWEFMENYIKKKENDISIKETLNTKNKNNKIPDLKLEYWKHFSLGEIFEEIYKSKAYIKSELTVFDENDEKKIPFISRTDKNNGCDCYVPLEEIETFELGNCIIIGDTTSTVYYQKENFVTGDHIVVCRAKWINKYTALFIKTIIEKERYKYNYGRAFKMELIKTTKIILPIKRDGNGEAIIDDDYKYSSKGYIPDWEFMENYIKSLPYGDKI